MARQSFIWTSLPHGAAAEGALRLAVFLTPRLGDVEAGTALSAFPLWTAWPQQVREALPNLTFEVRARTAGAPLQRLGPFRPDPARAQQLWPEGWQAIFSTAIVQPFAMRSIADRNVQSFSAGELNGEIKGRYNRAAAATVARDDDLRRNMGRNRVLLDAPAEEEPPEPALREFLAFHERASTPALVADIKRQDERAPDRPEFHEVLSWIGSYPELLPRLGLVFDLLIPRSALAPTGLLHVQANPLLAGQEWPPRCRPGEPCSAQVEHHAPFTAVDAATFWPRASDPDDPTTGSMACASVSRGLLCPRGDSAGRGRMLVSQIDFEGSSLKLATNGSGGNGTSRERLLPALRNAGFSLIRARQRDLAKAQAHQAETHNAQLGAGEEPVLWAQNLNRGYRLDVFENRSLSWRSLHQRHLDYGVADQPPRERISGEGFVQVSAMVAGSAGNGHADPNDLLMLETLARWRGWSLTVPPPLTVADPVLTEPAIPAPNPFGLAIAQSVVDGSLPRLRFGDAYRFRIRAVNLAGHSPSLAEASVGLPSTFLVTPPSWASLPGSDRDHRYLRYEPIGPPVLVPRAPGVSSGKVHSPRASLDGVDALDEVVDRLVLRSNGDDASAEAYAERFPQWTFANQLHLVPPRIAPATAEAHGMIDEALERGDEEAIDAIFELIQRAGDLPEHEPGAELALPYLPDPLARGVTVRALGDPEPLAGGVGEPITFCRYRAAPSWPHLLPFRLELGEAAAYRRPTYDAGARLLTVKLPPGTQVKLALSSFFTRTEDALIPNDLKSLGLWAWFAEAIQALKDGLEFDGIKPGTALGQALADMDSEGAQMRAGEGRFWFLTPPQTLLLVHALQQPLRAPKIATIDPRRTPGETFVSLLNTIEIHPESTARLALTAAWDEVIDEPPAPPKWLPHDDPLEEQRRVPAQAAVREQQILEPHDQGEHPYLWEEGKANPWWPRKGAISLRVGGALEGPGTENQVAVDARGARLPDVSSLPPLRHEFGDTKHRHVTYRVIGTSRFQNDFPPPSGTDRETWTTRRSDPVTVNIVSSARPVPPVIREVVPAFQRRTQRQGNTLIRRKTGGIRVYLDRPWFTTGAEESLAVVLWSGAQWPLPAGHRAAAISTRWGRDPIWQPVDPNDSLLVPSQPAPAHFPLRDQGIAGSESFTVPNGAALGQAFQVAAHRVRFNAERDLWFADLQIDLGDAYFPFVQLALGRFQPHSASVLHLSEVTLIDPVQIAPARRVEATLMAGTPRNVQVRVHGTAQATTEGPGGMALPGNRVQLQVERRPRGADDLAWQPATLPGPIAIEPLEPASDLLWSGEFPLPPPSAGEEMRVLVLEDDFLAADGPQAGQFVATPRLAYAESVLVDELMVS